MTDDKPDHSGIKRVTEAMDEFMASVLRNLRMGQGTPLEDLGLRQAGEELQNWRPDVPGVGAEPDVPGAVAEPGDD